MTMKRRRLPLGAALMWTCGLLLWAAVAHAQPTSAGERIVGVWRVRTPDLEMVFEARADGTYSRVLIANGSRTDDGGTYRFADGKLHLQPRDDGPLTLSCRLTEDGQLEVIDDEGNGFRMVRQTPVGPVSEPAQGERPRAVATTPAGARGASQPVTQMSGFPPLENPTGFCPPFPLRPEPGGHIVYTRIVHMRVSMGGLDEVVAVPQLFIMRADGSGQTPFLAPQDYVTVKEARWSPLYDRLVFSSDWMQARSVCVQDIFIAHADGSGIYRVTGNEIRGPAPGGYGSVTGVIVDNHAQDGERQVLEPTRLQICVAGQGGDGTITHPTDAESADVINPHTRQKVGEARVWRFYLPRVAARTQSWVRVWRDKRKGNVVFVPIKANAENDVGVVELDVANYSAGNGNVTPDGRYVVGVGALGGAASVCVFDGASGALLSSWSTPVGTFAKEPALSPDGTQVAVGWGEFAMENLAVVSLADLLAGRPNPRVLVAGERVLPSAATGFRAGQFNSGTPAWSPDGRTIAFCRGLFATELITGNLWLINADGSGLRQLTHFGPECLVIQPCFSPDGTRVAFTVLTGLQGLMRPEQFAMAQFSGDIYSIGVDGSGLQRLTNDGVSGEPAWGP